MIATLVTVNKSDSYYRFYWKEEGRWLDVAEMDIRHEEPLLYLNGLFRPQSRPLYVVITKKGETLCFNRSESYKLDQGRMI